MRYEDLLDGMARFGAAREDICPMVLGVPAARVRPNVVLAPTWAPQQLPALGADATPLFAGSPAIETWDVRWAGLEATYLRAGVGAPLLLDTVLALGVTACERVVFVGSVGALDADMAIGDVVIPAWSLSGDGASRYIAGDSPAACDVFGERALPDAGLLQKALALAGPLCQAADARCHVGHTFSIDTILAQFAHLDTILALGCDTIEMETAAAFRAARLAGLAMVALFSVSDNSLAGKSLISGRTAAERARRNRVREEVLPALIADILR